MAVVSASHPLGCGKAHLTVLGKMASIRRVLPVSPDYSTSIRRPGSIEFPGNRMVLVAAFPRILQSCATEPCLKFSGSPLLIPFLGLIRLLGWEARRDHTHPLCWDVPRPQPCLDSLLPSRLGFWLHPDLPSASLKCPKEPTASLALKQPLERKTACLQKRSLDF